MKERNSFGAAIGSPGGKRRSDRDNGQPFTLHAADHAAGRAIRSARNQRLRTGRANCWLHSSGERLCSGAGLLAESGICTCTRSVVGARDDAAELFGASGSSADLLAGASGTAARRLRPGGQLHLGSADHSVPLPACGRTGGDDSPHWPNAAQLWRTGWTNEHSTPERIPL